MVLLFSGCAGTSFDSAHEDSADAQLVPWVVVADIDSGANIFHPAFRRATNAHPSEFLPGFPAEAEAINFAFGTDFDLTVEAAGNGLQQLRQPNKLFWIPNTNIVGMRADARDEIPIFDAQGNAHVHGAKTSSEIAGINYSYAPEAWLVLLDDQADRPNQPIPPGANVDPSVFELAGSWMRWASEQTWIDVLHTALQNFLPLARGALDQVNPMAGQAAAVQFALENGKFIAAAAGNTEALSSEWNAWSGPPGVLAVGANDNCGWYPASRYPDIVMDGGNTTAASHRGYGNATFGGTSGASSLATGYVAHLIFEIRTAFGDVSAVHDKSFVNIPDSKARPAVGPLADGQLTAAELHEVIRKTADPKSHESKFDGGQRECVANQSSDPEENYERMGYGEISEHTMPHAIAVILGTEIMPVRSEDVYFAASQERRATYWETLPP